MRVLLAGASGLLGSHVAKALLARGDEVVALSRDPARRTLPAGCEVVAWDGASPLPAVDADAVANFAGQGIADHRWTAAYRDAMRASRIGVTRRLVEWIAKQEAPPPYVGASGGGYYGLHPRGPCAESRPPGDGFLARLAADWEEEAAQSPGASVVLRIGIVLAREGGYVAALKPLVRRHLAGPIAGGQQPLSWAHVDDVARAALWALDDKDARGAYNVASPGAAGTTQGDVARAMARIAGKPLQLSVPLWMVRLRFGDGPAAALAGGQDLDVHRIQRAGFTFDHLRLDDALRQALDDPTSAGRSGTDSRP